MLKPTEVASDDLKTDGEECRGYGFVGLRVQRNILQRDESPKFSTPNLKPLFSSSDSWPSEHHQAWARAGALPRRQAGLVFQVFLDFPTP